MLLFGVYQNKTLMPLVPRVSAIMDASSWTSISRDHYPDYFKGLDDTFTYGKVIADDSSVND